MHKNSMSRSLLILSPSIVLVALGMDIIIPCIPAISSDLGSNFAATQWVLSAYSLGTGIGQLVIGPLADRFGRRRTILISILLFITASLLCAKTQGIYALVVARFFQGIGACGAYVIVMAIVRDIYDENTISKAYSYLNAVIALTPILAPVLGGYLLVKTEQWSSCFIFAGLFGIIAFIVNFRYLEESLSEQYKTIHHSFKNTIKNYLKIVLNYEFLSYNACSISALTGIFLFFSISPIIMIDTLHLEPNIYALYFAMNFIAFLIGNILSPKIEEYIKIKKVISFGSIIMLIAAMIMLSWHIINSTSIAGLMLPALIMSIGSGLIYGPCIAGALNNFKHIAGTASATYGALLYLISSLIVTIVMQYQVYNTFIYGLVMICMSAINLIIMFTLSKRHKS